ncbi:MAG: hypothetical protein QG656_670, partial [Candidatus Hydrogenedentes bacterium]|nr:hypothetical protein [Candidatus Hydrogenedentota bacterium]
MTKMLLLLLVPFVMSWLFQSPAAAQEPASTTGETLRLPESETHWKKVEDWIERDPDPDYVHASAAARE